MPLPLPALDDRSFAQLLAEARSVLAARCPEWTDQSPNDPASILLELYAYLTETMLFRLNRVPEKVYVAFLDLLGVSLRPPAAASVTLRFTPGRPPPAPMVVPRGTRVTVARGSGSQEPPVFATVDEITLPAGPAASDGVEVRALHCELVDGELLGTGTGAPAQRLRVSRPPIVSSTGDDLDLVIGVEADPAELTGRAPAREFRGKVYRLWREVPDFAGQQPDDTVFVADRAAGTITFAPAVRVAQPAPVPPAGAPPDEGAPPARDRPLTTAPVALAALPGAGRPIRGWYRCGGGETGNVPAGALTVLKDPLPGVTVTNPAPAAGGAAAETLANALLRGPQELHSVERVVTAQDYERAALRSSGAVARAHALTMATVWRHARPGTVQTLLVPAPGTDEAPAGAAELVARQTPEALARVRRALETRQSLGIELDVAWAHLKEVRVAARVFVHRAEQREAVARRLETRMNQLLSPVPAPDNPTGWPFGRSLRAFAAYDVLLSEQGVRAVDRVRLLVDDVPVAASALTPDENQPATWYCANHDRLFRSMDDGVGWELVGTFPAEPIDVVRTAAAVPGLVVAASRPGDADRTRLRLSFDCAETWRDAADLDFHVEDVAVLVRDGVPVLLLATDRGLYELVVGSTPVQLLVDGARPTLGFYTVTAVDHPSGAVTVVVSAQERGGVFLSMQAGRSGTFIDIGQREADLRCAAVRRDGPNRFLILGVTAASGNDPGSGAVVTQVLDGSLSPAGWRPLSDGWTAGSCFALAVVGSTLLAGSFRGGVLRWALDVPGGSWQQPDVESGLPLRDPGRFEPVTALAAAPPPTPVSGAATPTATDAGGPARLGTVVAGGPAGLRRSEDAQGWQLSAETVVRDEVTCPPTWLLCAGRHEIDVVTDDASL